MRKESDINYIKSDTRRESVRKDMDAVEVEFFFREKETSTVWWERNWEKEEMAKNREGDRKMEWEREPIVSNLFFLFSFCFGSRNFWMMMGVIVHENKTIVSEGNERCLLSLNIYIFFQQVQWPCHCGAILTCTWSTIYLYTRVIKILHSYSMKYI